MINIISKTKYAYVFSGVLTVMCIASLFVWGLKLGIDFTGGTLMEVQFENNLPSNSEIEENLKNLNLKSLSLQATGNNTILLRYVPEDDKTNQEVLKILKEKYPQSKDLRTDYANSTISEELKSKSLWSIFWAVAGIMAYIAWAFRKVSRPVPSWKYGMGAIIALVHDILITAGVFSVLGHFYGIEIGIPFVAALLTILGFSVHDTIVVYDRTRENLLRSSSKETFPEVVNRSLNETLVRSINTSMTVIITLLAIYIFGGESIKYFSLALLVGVTFGTYSSIFIASALLVTSYKLQIKKS
ncbi:MAG TPA: protein translocase subunit SecF [Candidatus Moranbacteria bacterium]|nr:protein translocase subunit SecF [Candidatus Moranbacteria bacterium]HBY10860.1 protein translocase subunit SecF [Candidatus Moranbacteria bacterium]